MRMRITRQLVLGACVHTQNMAPPVCSARLRGADSLAWETRWSVCEHLKSVYSRCKQLPLHPARERARMGLLNLCMKKNPFSRAFHFVLMVPCSVVAVMSAISLGMFVPLHLDIRNYDPEEGSGEGVTVEELRTCILFATPDRENRMVDYQPDNACDFTIWGQVAVGSLAIAMATVLFVKAFLGIKV